MVPYLSEIAALETFLIFGNIEFWYRSLSPFILDFSYTNLPFPLAFHPTKSSLLIIRILLIVLILPTLFLLVKLSSSPSSLSSPTSPFSPPHPHPSHAPHFILLMLLLNLTSQKKVQRTKCCVVRTNYTKVLKQALIYAPTVVYTNLNFLGKYCFSSRTFKSPQIIMKLNYLKFRRRFCRCIFKRRNKLGLNVLGKLGTGTY